MRLSSLPPPQLAEQQLNTIPEFQCQTPEVTENICNGMVGLVCTSLLNLASSGAQADRRRNRLLRAVSQPGRTSTELPLRGLPMVRPCQCFLLHVCVWAIPADGDHNPGCAHPGPHAMAVPSSRPRRATRSRHRHLRQLASRCATVCPTTALRLSGSESALIRLHSNCVRGRAD